MKSWNRASLSAVVICLMLPVSAYAETSANTELWYNIFVVWGPLVAMGGWFVYVMKGHSKLQKRSFEHMNKAEELLERIAKAVEQNGK